MDHLLTHAKDFHIHNKSINQYFHEPISNQLRYVFPQNIKANTLLFNFQTVDPTDGLMASELRGQDSMVRTKI